MNNMIRKTHRWLSVFFTLTVIANFVALGVGQGEAPGWVVYLPLFPLGLLWLSGTYLFVLPYVAKAQTARE